MSPFSRKRRDTSAAFVAAMSLVSMSTAAAPSDVPISTRPAASSYELRVAQDSMRARTLEYFMGGDLNGDQAREKALDLFNRMDSNSQTKLINQLVDKLDSPTSDLHPVYALYRLLDLFGGPLMEPVVRALKDERPKVRAGAAMILGTLTRPHVEMVRKIAPSLADPDPGVRAQARQSLANMRFQFRFFKMEQPDEEYTAALLEVAKSSVGRPTACLLMAQFDVVDRRALSTLIACLDDRDPEVRAGAALAIAGLGKEGEKAVRTLERLLADKDERVSAAALRALGMIGTKSASRALSSAAEAQREKLRELIVNADSSLKRYQNAAGAGNDVGDVTKAVLSAYSVAGSTPSPELDALVAHWKELRGGEAPTAAPGVKDLDFLASRSLYKADHRIRLAMDILSGEWCGSRPDADQLRVKFWPYKDTVIGGALWTFGNIGDPRYFIQYLLIPVGREAAPERVRLLAIRSDAGSQEIWWLSLKGSGPVVQRDRGDYVLASTCHGFWKCVADWERTEPRSSILFKRRSPTTLTGTPKGIDNGGISRPAVKVGDQVNFSMPFTNWERNQNYIYELYPYAMKSPDWLAPVCSSYSASPREKINPGQTTVTSLAYQVISQPKPTEEDTVEVGLKAGTGNLHPSSVQWVFRSSNAFRTVTGECLGYEGGARVDSYGGFVTADTDPPVTEITFKGPAAVDPSGTIFVSSRTEIGIDASKTYMPDVASSEIVFRGLAMDRSVKTLSDLGAFVNPITLGEGSHEMAIGSSDEAGNAEVIHSIPIIVSSSTPVEASKIEQLDYSGLRNGGGSEPAQTFEYEAPPVTLLMTW